MVMSFLHKETILSIMSKTKVTKQRNWQKKKPDFQEILASTMLQIRKKKNWFGPLQNIRYSNWEKKTISRTLICEIIRASCKKYILSIEYQIIEIC